MNIVYKDIKDFKILPGPPGTCPECAVMHDPEAPHNWQSLTYQYRFYQAHGRWPTWKDAMAHCTPDIQKICCDKLRENGIDV